MKIKIHTFLGGCQMPKFARPNSYTGKKANQSWTGDTRAANAVEAAAGESATLYISPLTLAESLDTLVPHASTTDFGVVQLATLSELENGNAPMGAYVPTSNDVATVINGIVVGAVPPATETLAGIAKIATQAETNTGSDDTKIVTPLKLATYVAGGSGAGSFTDLTATGAVSFTGATGGLTMTSTTASSLGVSGAGIDLTLDSAAGQLILTGGEAAVNAVRVQADDAAGGIDIDAGTGGITIDTTGAFSIDGQAASNVTVTGAGLDLTLASVLGSVLVSSTENAALAIRLHANGGTSETIQVHSDQGTGVASVGLLSDVGGITLRSTGLASGDAINLEAAAGGVDIDAALQVNIASSQNAIDAIRIVASAGGIDIDAVGAATEDINITNTGGSVVLVATEAVADAITLTAVTALGGIDVNAGTGGMTVDSAGVLSLDATGATNLTTTGAFDLTIQSTAGSILLNAGEAVADAVNIDSTGGFDLDAALQINLTSSQAAATAVRVLASDTAGGIDVDAGTGGITIDTTGALSLDSAAASNFTVTGAFDLTLSSSAGSIVITGAEAAADAIQLNAVTAGGGVDVNAGSGGVTVDTTAAISLDSATASNFTVTGAADLTLASSAGAVNITSGEANADSLNMTSGGGFSLVATGAAAKDVIITSTSGSMTLTAGENVTDAMNFTASGGASRINLTAGTGSVKIASGLIIATKDLVFADSPYTVLGTDYFLSVDTSGGAITVTLPNAATVTGRTYVIRDTGGAAAASNITVATAGGNLVGGGASAATKTISTAYAGATVYSNGVTWNYCYVA